MIWILLNRVAHASGDTEAISFDPITFFVSASWEVKAVMVVLILMMLGTAVIFVERLIAFLRSRSHSVKVALAVLKPMRAHDLETALSIAKRADYKAGHLTALLKAGFTELIEHPNEIGIANAGRAIDKQTAEQQAKLKQWFGILATTGATAPFVGLAGTTRGVISAFTAMGLEGAGLSSISIGISEALWTTFFGIVVAIFGVWAFNFFNGRLEKTMEEMETAKSDFITWATKFVASGGIMVDTSAEGEDATAEADDAPPADAAPAPAGK